MSHSIRSIRGIERTKAYMPIQAVTAYGYFPYRDREAQLSPEPENDWNRHYKHAADSAAAWVNDARQAQAELDHLIHRINMELQDDVDIKESLHKLADVVNRLEYQFSQHADELKPELWESVEHALGHPAAETIGLRRSLAAGQWFIDVQQHNLPQTVSLRRMLLGTNGMLNTLKHALAYGDQIKAIDLVKLQVPISLPYGAYYGAMHDYSPLPYPGLILNKYV